MVTTYEFRVLEEFAGRLFRPHEGQRLAQGLVRKVLVPADDVVRLRNIAQVQRDLRKDHNRPLFLGWYIHRKYTEAELSSADFLTLRVDRTFEPAGEECGTHYNEDTACAECGSGATQVGPLRLNGAKVPRGVDFAITIAGEPIVTDRLANVLGRTETVGVELDPVVWTTKKQPEDRWHQLRLIDRLADVRPPTRTGSEPFVENPDDSGRCSRGDLFGLNLLTELFVHIEDSLLRKRSRIIGTVQFFGVRRGLLRPQPVLLISQTTWRAIRHAGINGFHVEIARLV